MKNSRERDFFETRADEQFTEKVFFHRKKKKREVIESFSCFHRHNVLVVKLAWLINILPLYLRMRAISRAPRFRPLEIKHGVLSRSEEKRGWADIKWIHNITFTHSLTHTHSHALTRTHMHSHALTLTLSLSHTLTHSHTPTLTHALSLSLSHFSHLSQKIDEGRVRTFQFFSNRTIFHFFNSSDETEAEGKGGNWRDKYFWADLSRSSGSNHRARIK